MIKKQFEKVGKKIAEQSHKLLGTDRRSKDSKRERIDRFVEDIQKHVKEVKRDDIAFIIVTWTSEVRSWEPEERQQFFRDMP